MEQSTSKEISVQLLNAILQYLAQKPYAEVFQLVNSLTSLSDIKTYEQTQETKGE